MTESVLALGIMRLGWLPGISGSYAPRLPNGDGMSWYWKQSSPYAW